MSKHSGSPTGRLASLRKSITTLFVKRQAEQIAVVFASGFVGALSVSGGNLSGAVLTGALSAALRAVYGWAVKHVSQDGQTPSVK